MTIEEQNKLARRTILHLLNRVRKEPEMAKKMGATTETFDLLTAAASALSGEPLPQVRNFVSPGSAYLPHSTAEEYLQEL